MHNSAQSVTVCVKNVHAVPECFANMEHNGITKLLCKLKLFRKPFSLTIARGKVIVIIQPDFTESKHFFVLQNI